MFTLNFILFIVILQLKCFNFSNFLLMYDRYVLGNDAAYCIFGTSGQGMQLLKSGQLIEGKEFSVFVGNFLVKGR